jgi:hypothetical protein
MARDITVTFEDGTQHVYRNAPDDITPDAVTERAKRDFGKAVTALDGGRGGAPEQPAAAVPQPAEPTRSACGANPRTSARAGCASSF